MMAFYCYRLKTRFLTIYHLFAVEQVYWRGCVLQNSHIDAFAMELIDKILSPLNVSSLRLSKSILHYDLHWFYPLKPQLDTENTDHILRVLRIIRTWNWKPSLNLPFYRRWSLKQPNYNFALTNWTNWYLITNTTYDFTIHLFAFR